jgi:hypothetical protein
MTRQPFDFLAIRTAMAGFNLSPRVEPNDFIPTDSAYLPRGHRGVLDLRRQLIIGNRGMGKSFWTHALTSSQLRCRLGHVYGYRQLEAVRVEIGFNGSDKVSGIAPTRDDIADFFQAGSNPDLVWRAVFLRAADKALEDGDAPPLRLLVDMLERDRSLYAQKLSRLDDHLADSGLILLVVFDALDRLGPNWISIRAYTRALLTLVVGLQSFRAIRAKIFMRVDQLSDQELFRFPDSSKIVNDRVSLVWRPNELYGLLLFEILRNSEGAEALRELADAIDATRALPVDGADSARFIFDQERVIIEIAGEFMGKDKKRGRVYTWAPLHLSDASDTCSPRTFLTAWRKAAERYPPPPNRAVDHLGLQDGVRAASSDRLRELYEDYPWIEPALEALHGQFVPLQREQLFEHWRVARVLDQIMDSTRDKPINAPVGFTESPDLEALLNAMVDVAVMEERANGKINVPDIFRVEAGILRRGGVAVPRRIY